jgi:hypothetical protein
MFGILGRRAICRAQIRACVYVAIFVPCRRYMMERVCFLSLSALNVCVARYATDLNVLQRKQVKLKSVNRDSAPSQPNSAGPSNGKDESEGVQVETLFGARLLREEPSQAATPFGARLKQKPIHVQQR